MRTIGMDVSHWEGIIDWPVASRYLGFAYYKCTDGVSYVDPTFYLNRAGCIEFGLAHAPYHFYQPALDPVAQAEHFIHTAGQNYPRYIVDVEEPEGVDEGLPGKLLTFLLCCAQLTGGVKPAIYTSPGYWNEYVRPKPAWAKNYDLIVAHYTAEHIPTLPLGWDQWRIWQFSDFYFAPGCNTEIDGDWFNGTLEQCRQWFGNYRQVDPPIVSLRARSYFDNLHVRQHPSIEGKEISHLAKGDAVVIEDLAGKDVWIKHSAGWTCVEKDGYRYMEVIK